MPTWGDGRLFVLGTEGYIELRKYINVASGLEGGNHLYIVDKKQARYIDCKNVQLPFGPQFVADIVNRTQVAQDQEQALLAAELVLKAQKIATRPISSEEYNRRGNHELHTRAASRGAGFFAPRRWPTNPPARLRALQVLRHLRARRNRRLERHAAVELTPVSYVIRKNNLAEIGRGTLTPGKPAKIEAKLDEPGMVYVEVTENKPGAKPRALGAAVAPEKIAPADSRARGLRRVLGGEDQSAAQGARETRTHGKAQREGRRRFRHPQDESPRRQTRLGPGGEAQRHH